MKNKIPMFIGGFLAVLVVVGAIAAGVAYADDSTPPDPSARPADSRGPRGRYALSEAELEAAAQVLGMTADELSTALQNGTTLETLAEEAGVELQAVRDALSAVHADEMRAQIKQAVADGTISQDKADWLLEGLDKGYLDGPGFGLDFGRGGCGDHGRPPAGAPSNIQPTPAITN